MNSEADWTKRRQRTAKCKAHGLHYDPQLTSGCALCRKEGLAAEPTAPPQVILMLLALLGIAVIGYRVWGPGAIRAESAPPPAAPPAVAAVRAARLDPAPYREAMRAVDRALLETPGQSLTEMGGQIRSAMSRLSRGLRGERPEAGRAAVAAVAALSRPLATSPLTLELLRDLRIGWAELRGLHFEPAGWFLNPTMVDPRTDRAALTAYRDVATSLFSLINESSSQAALIAAPEQPNVPKDQDRIREEWQLFQSDWRQRVADLQQQLPSRPGDGADQQILLATQRLEQAFTRAFTLAAAGDVPSPSGLDDALTTAEQAQRSLDELLLQ